MIFCLSVVLPLRSRGIYDTLVFMTLTTLKYSTTASAFKKGNSVCYHARPIHNGTLHLDDIVEGAARCSAMDAATVKYAADLLLGQIRNAFANGCRLELGDVVGELSIRGSFPSKDAEWDASRNVLVPGFRVKGRLATCVKGLELQNVLARPKTVLKSVIDTVHKVESEIMGGENVVIYVAGVGLRTSTDPESGEGCWFEDFNTGEIVVRGVVLTSTMTTLDARFAMLPPPGRYRFAVATRGGFSSEHGPYVARRIVSVIPAAGATAAAGRSS